MHIRFLDLWNIYSSLLPAKAYFHHCLLQNGCIGLCKFRNAISYDRPVMKTPGVFTLLVFHRSPWKRTIQTLNTLWVRIATIHSSITNSAAAAGLVQLKLLGNIVDLLNWADWNLSHPKDDFTDYLCCYFKKWPPLTMPSCAYLWYYILWGYIH
jgi:hypothetical protein